MRRTLHAEDDSTEALVNRGRENIQHIYSVMRETGLLTETEPVPVLPAAIADSTAANILE